MSKDQKVQWIKKAGAKELLEQWFTFKRDNSYGRYDEDIRMVEKEILHRMNRSN